MNVLYDLLYVFLCRGLSLYRDIYAHDVDLNYQSTWLTSNRFDTEKGSLTREPIFGVVLEKRMYSRWRKQADKVQITAHTIDNTVAFEINFCQPLLSFIPKGLISRKNIWWNKVLLATNSSSKDPILMSDLKL